MVRTRTTGSNDQPPVPPVRATRGRGRGRGQGRGRGRGIARTSVGTSPVVPPVAPAQEQIPDTVEPAGPTQAPTTPIVIPGLQEALDHILIVCTGLAQVVLAQAVPSTSQDGGEDEQRRLERFERLRPPPFSGTESEDAQGFLDRFQWMLWTTGILETSGVSLTTFRFYRATLRWWKAYERCRPVGAVPLTWKEFSVLFLEKFVPQSRREELRRQFEKLHQDGMSVTQYEMRFSKLARHAVWLVPTDRERIMRFIDDLTYQLRLLMTRERVSSVTFDEVVYIAR
ncbi:uncharacterized protein [Nicotiana tomentosiformis]|uniref:uncharacterized protein n=1 Tax=Nicotiana tomentosiformis TaxID=4098 RepID=UPI00388CAAED